MLAIGDEIGAIAGFIGRPGAACVPKYLNSPQTATYRKGDLLFGLPQALPLLHCGATCGQAPACIVRQPVRSPPANLLVFGQQLTGVGGKRIPDAEHAPSSVLPDSANFRKIFS